MTVRTVLNFVAARLREPSTHAALATVIGLIGVGIGPDIVGQLCMGASAAFGLAGIGLSERGHE